MLDKLVIIIFYLANFKFNVVFHIDSFDAVAVWGKILIHARDPRIRLTTNPGFIVFVFFKQLSIFFLHLPLII